MTEEEDLNFDIVMKDEVYDKLFCLMENIKDLNEGNEIGAWLLGKWTDKDDGTLKLVVDKFIIPKQEVSGAGVDMGPEGMIDTIQQLTKKDSPIIGHWHIHPFGQGDTSWSGPDEAKIKDWMIPEKGRKIFVFMLSSLDQLKARVEVVVETKYPVGKRVTTQLDEYDDLPVRRENAKENKVYLKELTKTIKDKVSSKVYEPVVYSPRYRQQWGKPYSQMDYAKEKVAEPIDEGPQFIIARAAGSSFVRVKIKKKLVDFLDFSNTDITKEFGVPTSTKEKESLTMYGFSCADITSAALLETNIERLLQSMSDGLAIYYEGTDIGSYNKSYDKSYNEDIDRVYHY